MFLASGPDLIEQVLVTDAKHYIKHFGARAFKPVLGNGLVTSEGAFWHRQRKLIQPAFLKNRVQSYAQIMAELTDQMLNSWSPGKSVQIDYEFEALTSKIALKTLFDLEDSWRSPAVQWHVEARIRANERAASPDFQTPALGANAGKSALAGGSG